MSYTDSNPDFISFLKRILLLNVFFALSLTALSFIFFLMYDYNLWKAVPLWAVLKVFLQNLRFNLSVISYMNIPVLVLLFVFPAINALSISRFLVTIIKVFYVSCFMVIFMSHLSFLVSDHLFIKFDMDRGDMIANIINIFMSFDNQSILTVVIAMMFFAISTFIFFALLAAAILVSKTYDIIDKKKSVIWIFIILLVCIFLGKGKIIGRLSIEDSQVTPSVQLNKYSLNGIYSTANAMKKFRPAHIKNMDPRGLYKVYETGDISSFSLGDTDISKELFEFKESLGVDINTSLQALEEVIKQTGQ